MAVPLLPTTLVGSYPQPDWLIDKAALVKLGPPRVRAREVWRIVREITAGGIAAVIVDKNHAAVTATTTRSVILVKGRVVFDGTSAELRTRGDVIRQHLGV